ncbi:MAG: NAD(P)H-hydrate dehydratase [Microcystaceae cyanobacterium]
MTLDSIIVSALQMQQIEERIFAAGMPVAALMEKVANLCAQWLESTYPVHKYSHVGFLIGPGHNGGDGLVIARELHLKGYQVSIYCPFDKLKELTSQHAQYAQNLGIPFSKSIQSLENTHLIIDGLFGFNLTRPLKGELAEAVNSVNLWQKPTVSIDIPSGLYTDTGEVLGVAIKATQSLCLGLWKLAYFQDQALDYLGKVTRIDFGIPTADVISILGNPAPIQQITPTIAKKTLPIPRPLLTHKYKQGHLLLICGSSRYAGGAILTGLGARSSGVGMLSIAVPETLKPILVSQLPDALIIGCPETETGAIAQLPPLAADFSQYNMIACGPGLTLDAAQIFQSVLDAPCPLVLDADGLNLLAKLQKIDQLKQRNHYTVLTPHLGEFKRLFPHIENPHLDRIQAVEIAAKESQAIILLKGARTAIASPQGQVWLIPQSTPALARGGSGDVLTGLMGGLLAQSSENTPQVVGTAAWCHAQAGIVAAKERSEMGVDAHTLASYLPGIF